MIDAATGIEYGFIYKITNRVNGKIYIGQTVEKLQRRWTNHLYVARRKPRWKLSKAIVEYGSEHFCIDALAYVPITMLNRLETACIELFDSMHNGYNMRMDGSRISPEVRKRMSDAHRGKPSCRKGCSLSQAQKDAVGKSNRCRVVSPETRARMREAYLRNLTINPDKFKKTAEQKEATRLQRLGTKAAQGVAEKMSAASKGKPKSEEHKASMKAAWVVRRAKKADK